MDNGYYTVKTLIQEGAKRLKLSNISSAVLDARTLLSYVTSHSIEKLLAENSANLPSRIVEKFFQLIQRRKENEPIAYIVKEKEFYSINFTVDKNVLIPRPDSETLIDLALSHIKSKKRKEKISVLDLGTGSGCLLLTLLYNLPNTIGTGIDISSKAINVAKKNALQLHLNKRANFLVSDWFSLILKSKFDLIISNPPYIKSKDIPSLQKDVKEYEPITALDGGKDGLYCYRKIFSLLENFLNKDGICIVEIGAGQFQPIKKIAVQYNLKLQEFKKDLSGKIRVMSFAL